MTVPAIDARSSRRLARAVPGGPTVPHSAPRRVRTGAGVEAALAPAALAGSRAAGRNVGQHGLLECHVLRTWHFDLHVYADAAGAVNNARGVQIAP